MNYILGKRKMNERKPRAIVIGDSTNNTLSAIRSLGEARIEQILILICENDICFVSKSKYIRHSKVFHITCIDSCMEILQSLKSSDYIQTIMCTFDLAAEYIDRNEELLSSHYITPARGRHIGRLFNKDEQCKLAEKCGLIVPRSIVFSRKDSFSKILIEYPILLKPISSTKGIKSDIHICQTMDDFKNALDAESHCQEFLIQEFIDKEYEVDCIGVRTDNEVYISGGVRKYRHFPPMIGAGAYGLFKPIHEYDIDIAALTKFLTISNYYGPFSVEFLYKDEKYYFMEVNFRNEGLAYVSTSAGANLHALYVMPDMAINKNRVHSVYMMNYSLDFLYVKNGKLTIWRWLKDLMRTRCFINLNFKDLGPTLYYYRTKFMSK